MAQALLVVYISLANHFETMNSVGSGSESDDGSVGVAFANVDFTGVDFDAAQEEAADDHDELGKKNDREALQFEQDVAFQDFSILKKENASLNETLRELGELLATGQYAQVLQSETARDFFLTTSSSMVEQEDGSPRTTAAARIRQQTLASAKTVSDCIAIEFLGIAALNLFLQGNYTGPTLNLDKLADINPHSCFTESLKPTTPSTDGSKQDVYQNTVLSELAVSGEWPCQVCVAPYFLLVARSILSTLADPSTGIQWTGEETLDDGLQSVPKVVYDCTKHLKGVALWSSRAVVVHERLLQCREPSLLLWKEADGLFGRAVDDFCPLDIIGSNPRAATVVLERGLAEHHFDRPGKGKKNFARAQEYSGLSVSVTGAVGKRTKFQQEATAQYLVKATSAASATEETKEDVHRKDVVREQMVETPEDDIRLERIKFEDDKENEITNLNILDQSILLSLCLDVKNNNPADGLTAEEMGAYLARVLDHHDDWMVYSTALLERAWLEFERNHGRERAILQMQALADQHTQRLTITQSTRKSIEDSAPVQDRLKMLHTIVYPPRWIMIQDLADRYSALGVVTSAAELYTEIEMYDDVVDCYKRAGKLPLARKIVKERLAIQETPRMWAALGDLTKEPEHYERAIELSKGRYSAAFVSLGAYYFDNKELEKAAENYEKALKIRPLAPFVWFRLGTISMQLERWDTALRAFSEVVQQEPTEGEAWANVAAIHMQNKKPVEAYPALNEALKYCRNNWRIWVSKLYTCLDLAKYDEAVHACNMLLDIKLRSDIPSLEPRCVKAIVGGAIDRLHEAKDDEAAQESARRTLSRVYELLNRIASIDTEPWVFETTAYFHEQVGQDAKVMENLMKEYRLLQSIANWEKEDFHVRKTCSVVSHIVDLHMRLGDKQNLTKAKFLARGVVKKIETARPDDTKLPAEYKRLVTLLKEVEDKLTECNTSS